MQSATRQTTARALQGAALAAGSGTALIIPEDHGRRPASAQARGLVTRLMGAASWQDGSCT